MILKFCTILFFHLTLDSVAQQTYDEMIVCTSTNSTSCDCSNCPVFQLNGTCGISSDNTIFKCEVQTTSNTSGDSECGRCCDDDYFSIFCNEKRIIAFVVILVLCIIIAVLVTFIVTCICVRRIYKKSSQSTQEQTSYEKVGHSSGTITKGELELHPNPAYGSGSKMTMNSNPAYKTCN